MLVVMGAAQAGVFSLLCLDGHFRNVVWEPLFGVGFLVAGLLFQPFTGNRIVGMIGMAWPLLLLALVGLLAWNLAAARPRWRWVAAFVFVVSLLAIIPSATADRLARFLPLFSNELFAWY